MEISIKCLVYFQLFSSVSLSLSHGCPQWPCRGSWGQFEPWLGTTVLPCFTHPVRCLQQGQEQQLSHRESFCIWTVTTEHSLTQRAEFILRESWADLIIQFYFYNDINEFLCMLLIFIFFYRVCLCRKL